MPNWLASLADAFTAFGREVALVELVGPRACESWKAAFSVLLGLALSCLLFDVDDAYWAAFSAFMVLRASVAETFTRGLFRVYFPRDIGHAIFDFLGYV